MVSQHVGEPFALHHINRALHRRVILDRCLKAHARFQCAGVVLKCVRNLSTDFEDSDDEEGRRRRRHHRRKEKKDTRSRMQVLLDKRNGRDSSQREGPDVAAMLDVRLKALDFMMNRTFNEEMLMAKQEMHPRRFQRNRKLQGRWSAAQDVLILQETLVQLRTARENREMEKASGRDESGAESKVDQEACPPSPGVRGTPEGESSDELVDNPGAIKSSQKTGSEIDQNTTKGQTNRETTPEAADGAEQANVTVTDEKGDPLAVPSTERDVSCDAKDDEHAPSECDLDSCVSRQDVSLSEILNEKGTMKNEKVLRSHSETCLTETNCEGMKKQDLWKKAFLMISRHRRAVKRMSYLRHCAPTMMTRLNRAAQNPVIVLPKENINGRVIGPGTRGDNKKNKSEDSPLPKIPRPSTAGVPKRRDIFDELCEKYSRHVGEAVHLNNRNDSFLPLIPVASPASPVPAPSPDLISLPSLDGITDDVSPEPSPRESAKAPFSDRQQRPAESCYLSTPPRVTPIRLPPVTRSSLDSPLSAWMNDRIQDITRIYASPYFHKMRQSLYARVKTIQEERQNS